MNFDEICEMRQVVSEWVSNLPYNLRIYLYGSQLKGLVKEHSDVISKDLDDALEKME